MSTDFIPSRLITCDEVFEVLTSGPFPTADPELNKAVEAHLRCCHDCQNLAQALLPACEALSESLPEVEIKELPQFDEKYWNQLSSDNQSSDYLTSNSFFRKYPFTISAVSSVCCFLVGLLVCFSLPIQPEIKETSGTMISIQHQPKAESRLLSLNYNQACFSKPTQNETQFIKFDSMLVNSSNTSQLQCCSRCHHQAQPNDKLSVNSVISKSSLLAIVSSCQACHTN